MAVSNSEAVKTAGERLESIEAWSKRSFIAAAISASCLAIMTLACLYVSIDYIRMKWAMQDAATSFQKDMQQRFPAPKAAPASPATKSRGTF